MSAQIACTGDEICNSVSLAMVAWMITTLKTSTTSIEQSRTKIKQCHRAIEASWMASTNFLDGFQANFNASTSRNLPQTNTAIENPCRWSISSKDADFAAKWRYQILGLACELSIPCHIRKPVFLWLLFQTTISYWCMTSIELTHFFPAFLVERGQISSSSHGLSCDGAATAGLALLAVKLLGGGQGWGRELGMELLKSWKVAGSFPTQTTTYILMLQVESSQFMRVSFQA